MIPKTIIKSLRLTQKRKLSKHHGSNSQLFLKSTPRSYFCVITAVRLCDLALPLALIYYIFIWFYIYIIWHKLKFSYPDIFATQCQTFNILKYEFCQKNNLSLKYQRFLNLSGCRDIRNRHILELEVRIFWLIKFKFWVV